MRFLSGLVAAAGLATIAVAADAKFTLTGDNTTVGFTGTKPGGKHDGGFKKVTGTATVDPADPTTTKIEVTIDTTSLWSDNEKLTGHLKSPDFFDVKTNPKATFVTTTVTKAGSGYEVAGKLTLNGKTNDVTFPAELSVSAGMLRLSSEFKIDRTAWGMTYGQGKVDNPVTIRVKVEAKQ